MEIIVQEQGQEVRSGERESLWWGRVEVVEADLRAWRELAGYHYRDHGHPGAVDKVFALRTKAEEGRGEKGKGRRERGERSGERRERRKWSVEEKCERCEECEMEGQGKRKGGEARARCPRHARTRRPRHELGEIRAALGAERTVGVIVYGMPVPGVALRNRATGNRYAGIGSAAGTLHLLNREIRCINRVVIHPQFRGLGLARRLVAETLGRAGTELVEALAAMGRVNPFFEQAGMVRYEGPAAARNVRLREAFGQVGIGREQMCDAEMLMRALERLGAGEGVFVEREVEVFLRHYKKRRAWGDMRERVGQVVARLGSEPVYYLWKGKELKVEG